MAASAGVAISERDPGWVDEARSWSRSSQGLMVGSRARRRSQSPADLVSVRMIWLNCRATNLPSVIAVRDSKDPDGPALTLTPAQWRSFATAVQLGDFDLR